MIGGEVLAPFWCQEFNKFLEEENPSEQSRFSILFGKEILESGMNAYQDGESRWFIVQENASRMKNVPVGCIYVGSTSGREMELATIGSKAGEGFRMLPISEIPEDLLRVESYGLLPTRRFVLGQGIDVLIARKFNGKESAEALKLTANLAFSRRFSSFLLEGNGIDTFGALTDSTSGLEI
ncbi:hypothetical protein Tco_0296806 [Tanacetum coccineum]|uniref:Uncharacterized protein n=1 Tax=Tanacetum coccineum TaxID=301880 RepID=A0ABQ5H2R8_9ASTR